MKNIVKKKCNKKSLIGFIIGSIVSVVGIVIAIVTGYKKGKIKLKDHPTKYKPL